MGPETVAAGVVAADAAAVGVVLAGTGALVHPAASRASTTPTAPPADPADTRQPVFFTAVPLERQDRAPSPLPSEGTTPVTAVAMMIASFLIMIAFSRMGELRCHPGLVIFMPPHKGFARFLQDRTIRNQGPWSPPLSSSAADSQFRWWWPTNWMAVPSAIFFVGRLLVAVPVRRSPDQATVGMAALSPSAPGLPRTAPGRGSTMAPQALTRGGAGDDVPGAITCFSIAMSRPFCVTLRAA